MAGRRRAAAEKEPSLTGGVCELILLPLYAVLEGLCIATGYLYALLDGLGIDISHVCR
jgi:hypothetical protein